MNLNLFIKILSFILFLNAQMALANDVIMATSEDLKEFDQLISKEPPSPKNNPQQLMPNQNTQNKKKKNNPNAPGDPNDPRKEFKKRDNNSETKPDDENRPQNKGPGPRRGGKDDRRDDRGGNQPPIPGGQQPPPPPPHN